MIKPTFDHPSFAVSNGRMRKYEECPRAAYYHYYGSFPGWKEDAPEHVRTAYRLKKLQTISMALGQELHNRAEELVGVVRTLADMPTQAELEQRTRNGMNARWRASKNQAAFRRSPARHPMLYEAYYRKDVSSARVQGLKNDIAVMTRHLLDWSGWAEVAACDDVSIPAPFLTIEFRGTPLMAASDLVYRADASTPWVLQDWKTGSEEGVELQLFVAGVLFREQGHAPPFIGRVVNLKTGKSRDIEIDEAALQVAERAIRNGEWAMRGYLEDMDARRNVPLPVLQWPALVGEKCSWCPFLEVCDEAARTEPVTGPF